jgi:lipopolysaccharide transport system ATP-binding protein
MVENPEIAIIVEDVSKIYRIGTKEETHENIVSATFDFLKSPLKNYRKYRSLYKFDDLVLKEDSNEQKNMSEDIIWALKDVSLKVGKGEVVGLIGRNGAGKSTLLKILSRITAPTSGCAKINGKISSLLEVGTGFHPELTGRDNVYLNGTILGMHKKEIDRKFDDIVDFSGVAKYIDTPVKRYSSGMSLRLAFSVAAHLDSEIMIIDEVLAVGDAEFQSKCIKRMDTVTKEGKTVIFVSHNMAAIAQLCNRVIWLDQGRVVKSGPTETIVSEYLSSGKNSQAQWEDLEASDNSQPTKIRSVKVLCENGDPVTTVSFSKDFCIEIVYDVNETIRNHSITFYLYNSQGVLLFESIDSDSNKQYYEKKPGRYRSLCNLPSHLLKPGTYYMDVISFVMKVKQHEVIKRAVEFDILEVGYFPEGRYGVVTPLLKWQIEPIGRIGNRNAHLTIGKALVSGQQ